MIVFILCLLVSPILSAPTPRNEFHEHILDFYGEDTDLVQAEKIIWEEAARLGMTTAYFDTCTANVESLKLTRNEMKELSDEAAATHYPRARFSSTDEVLPLLAVRSPKLHAAIRKRLGAIEKQLSRFDQEAQSFVRIAGDIVLERIVAYSQTENSLMNFSDMVTALNEITVLYHHLPQSSKNSLERAYCLNTSLRIMSSKNKFQILFAKLAHI